MTLDYFYGQVGELFSFYRIPKALFLESRFQNLSTDAKTLYGILLDRMSLSAKNGWLDEQGRVFIIFTIEDVKRALCCADNKATKLLRELEEFGLIERKRRGLGRPSLVYTKFMWTSTLILHSIWRIAMNLLADKRKNTADFDLKSTVFVTLI